MFRADSWCLTDETSYLARPISFAERQVDLFGNRRNNARALPRDDSFGLAFCESRANWTEKKKEHGNCKWEAFGSLAKHWMTLKGKWWANSQQEERKRSYSIWWMSLVLQFATCILNPDSTPYLHKYHAFTNILLECLWIVAFVSWDHAACFTLSDRFYWWDFLIQQMWRNWTQLYQNVTVTVTHQDR